LVGNHIVRLGNGDDINAKFRRLYIFYQQVMSKTGFDAYKVVDVQYKGQVVASKGNDNGKIDSVQLRKNVEKLLKRNSIDTMSGQTPVMNRKVNLKDSTGLNMPGDENSLTERSNTPASTTGVKTPDPNPVKSFLKPGTNNQKDHKNNKVPKAIMPKPQNVNN